MRVQADRSAGRLTGSMMELQTLQEALKVEIQIHQVRRVSRPRGQWVKAVGWVLNLGQAFGIRNLKSKVQIFRLGCSVVYPSR